MVEYFEQHSDAILLIAIIAAIVIIIICILAKLFRIAIGVAILAILIPILFTIFWGDGTSYVEKIASFMSPKYQQQIEDAYDYFKDKDNEDPLVDYDAVKDAVSDVITDVFSDINK